MLEREHILGTFQRRDAMQRAELHRLARAARHDLKSSYIHQRLMVWMGRRLVRAGFRLLIRAKAWEHRANTVYNGDEFAAIETFSKSNIL